MVKMDKPLKQQPGKLVIAVIILIALLALGAIGFSIWRLLEFGQIKEDISQLKTNCDFTSRSLNLLALNESWTEGYRAGVSNATQFYNNNLQAAIDQAQIGVVAQLCQRTPNPLVNERISLGNNTMPLCDYVKIRGG